MLTIIAVGIVALVVQNFTKPSEAQRSSQNVALFSALGMPLITYPIDEKPKSSVHELGVFDWKSADLLAEFKYKWIKKNYKLLTKRTISF